VFIRYTTQSANKESQMTQKYSGRCLCGEINYSTDAEPLFTGNCHCKACQRSSGSAFIPAMFFPEKNVSICGEAKFFASASDLGGEHRRGFCQNCGSQLFAKFSAMPGMIGIKAGTLDNAANYVPTMDFYVASAAPWDHMNPLLPKKPGAAQG
jgi:hypothetical protein